MYAVKFQTKIREGIINIPEEYKDRFKAQVRVILMAEEEALTTNMIDELLKNPVKIAGFRPLTREEIHERF